MNPFQNDVYISNFGNSTSNDRIDGADWLRAWRMSSYHGNWEILHKIQLAVIRIENVSCLLNLLLSHE